MHAATEDTQARHVPARTAAARQATRRGRLRSPRAARLRTVSPRHRTCCTGHAAASDAGLLPATSRGAANSSHAPRGFWPLSAQLERCARARRAPARRVRFGRSRTLEVPAGTLRPQLCPGPVQGARHQGAPSRAAECGPRRPRAPEPCGRAAGEAFGGRAAGKWARERRAWAVQTRERAGGAPEVLFNVARGALGPHRAAPPALYTRTPGARPHRRSIFTRFLF
jgi:hypothetical protein